MQSYLPTNMSCRAATQASGCIIRLEGECVTYTGGRLSGPNINPGDTFNIVVSKLNSFITAGPGTVTSVGLTMPAAFHVTGSPITSAGTFVVTALGSSSQYIRGDGALATLPILAIGSTVGSGTTGSVLFIGTGPVLSQDNSNFFWDNTNKRLGIGTNSPTASLQLKAGSTTANTAPLKLTSGALMTTAEAGAVEFLTDKLYATITTGAARKELTLNDIALTPATMPIATTNGRLTNGPWALVGTSPFDILTATKPVQGVSFIVTSGPTLSISGLNFSNAFLFQGSGSKVLNFDTKTFFGSSVTTPTATIQIAAGSATAGTAPIKLTSGTLLTTPETGAIEFNGTHFYVTVGSTRYQLDQQTTGFGIDSVLAIGQQLANNREIDINSNNFVIKDSNNGALPLLEASGGAGIAINTDQFGSSLTVAGVISLLGGGTQDPDGVPGISFSNLAGTINTWLLSVDGGNSFILYDRNDNFVDRFRFDPAAKFTIRSKGSGTVQTPWVFLESDTAPGTHRAKISSGTGLTTEVEGAIYFAVGLNPRFEINTGDNNEFDLKSEGDFHFWDLGGGGGEFITTRAGNTNFGSGQLPGIGKVEIHNSLTGSSQLFSLAIVPTWNTTGGPTALDVNVTDTASISTSLLAAFRVGGNNKVFIQKNGNLFSAGNVGIGQANPTARLHISGGTATANTAPIKLTAGTNMTTPESGAFEFDGTNLYFTVGGVRKTVTLT